MWLMLPKVTLLAPMAVPVMLPAAAVRGLMG